MRHLEPAEDDRDGDRDGVVVDEVDAGQDVEHAVGGAAGRIRAGAPALGQALLGIALQVGRDRDRDGVASEDRDAGQDVGDAGGRAGVLVVRRAAAPAPAGVQRAGKGARGSGEQGDGGELHVDGWRLVFRVGKAWKAGLIDLELEDLMLWDEERRKGEGRISRPLYT